MLTNFLGYIAINSVGKLLMKLSYRETDFKDFYILESFFGLILWGAYGILNHAQLSNVLMLIPITLLSALLSEFFIFFIYSRGDLNVIESVFSIYPLFTIFFAHVLLGEALSERFFLALAFILCGILIVSFQTSLKELRFNKSIAWALLGALAVGISDTISKSFVDSFSSYEFVFSLGISQTILSFLLIGTTKGRLGKIKNIGRKTATGTFLIALSMIFFWETFNSTLASIASPLTGSVVILIVILSRVFLKEKIPRKNYIAFILLIIGVFLLR